MEAAVRLGPDSWEVNKEAGLFYLFRGDTATATRHYEKAAELVKKSAQTGRSIRELVLEQGLMTDEELDRALDVLGMTRGG